jgi:hypothetical protein
MISAQEVKLFRAPRENIGKDIASRRNNMDKI